MNVPEGDITRLEEKIDHLLEQHDDVEQRVSELERWKDEWVDPQLELARTGAEERTDILKDIQHTLEPWKRRQRWWMKTREITVYGVTISYWLITKLGIAATGLIAIAMLILWLNGTIEVPK